MSRAVPRPASRHSCTVRRPRRAGKSSRSSSSGSSKKHGQSREQQPKYVRPDVGAQIAVDGLAEDALRTQTCTTPRGRAVLEYLSGQSRIREAAINAD